MKSGVGRVVLNLDDSTDLNEIISLISVLRIKKNIPEVHLNELFSKKIFIPCSIFNNKLSSLETIVKYLRENLGIRNKDVSELINRDERVVSTTYKIASRKFPSLFGDISFEHSFPVSLLSDRTKSVLELICSYLHFENDVSLKEISDITKRNYQTIWTAIRRFNEKNLKNSKKSGKFGKK